MADLISIWRKQKEARIPKLKKFLIKLRQHKGKRLDQFANELHEETFNKIDCLDCANCCSSIPPIVNSTDIKRIAKFLRMSPGEFETQFTLIDEDGDRVMNQSPCPFLESDNRCQVYDVRPKACRNYPHTDQYAFSQHMDLHIPNAKYCPAAFNILEEMLKRVPV